MTSELDGAQLVSTSRRRLLKAGGAALGVGLLGVGQGQVAAAGTTFPALAGPSSALGLLPASPIGGGADGSGAGADGAPPPPGAAQSRTLSAAAAVVPADPTSYNGWPVGSPGSVLGVQNYTVPGTTVVLPIRAGDVATVLMYVATRFNNEVEALVRGQCWGYDYRANVNNPSVWSNHASATAIDLNSLKHPNGVAGTFTAAKKAAVRQILAFCGDVVYWGEDYSGTIDGMHFEIDVPPGSASLAALVQRIQTGGSNPMGHLDELSVQGEGKVRLRGWAYDPDDPTKAISIAITVDGALLGWVGTGAVRPDVNQYFGIPGNHGFDLTIQLVQGQHTVTVNAINVFGGTDNPVIGGGVVKVTGGNPLGNFESASAAGGGGVRLIGWSYDPDRPSTEISVAAFIDGALMNWYPTGKSRPDVNQYFGIPGNHGFDITIPCGPGEHVVVVNAINVGPGTDNPVIGARRVVL
jgi:hypothetical protein